MLTDATSSRLTRIPAQRDADPRPLGYYAVAGMIGVESFGVPTPGQTIMVAAAIYAGAGRLNIFAVGAIAFIAAVVGDNIGYWIGVRGGRRVVHRFGKYVFLTPERLERAEGFFARRGGRIVVVARFIDGLRQFNGIIAGITAMPWRTFLLYNSIGAALWVGWWTTIAYLLGTHLVNIIEHAHHYKWWAIAIIALAVITYIILHVRHIKRRRARTAAYAERTSKQPTDSQPTDSQPGDAQPSDTQPGGSERARAEPNEAEPVRVESADTEPVTTKSADASLSTAESADADSFGIPPNGAEPIKAEPRRAPGNSTHLTYIESSEDGGGRAKPAPDDGERKTRLRGA